MILLDIVVAAMDLFTINIKKIRLS